MGATTTYAMTEIGDIVGSLRPFLENAWKEYKAANGRPVDVDEPASAGMCGFTAAFVMNVLNDATDTIWRVEGGRPNTGGGVVCRQGRQNGHFWTASDEDVIVDLTADQFGLPSVIVTTRRDARYLNSFSDEELEEHLPRVEPVAEYWMEAAVYGGLLRGAEAGISLR